MYMASTALSMSAGDCSEMCGDGASWLTISPQCSQSSHDMFMLYQTWRLTLFVLALCGVVVMVHMRAWSEPSEPPQSMCAPWNMFCRDVA